ncbi:MAG: EndoU domain-containing protein [Geminicoccaceae bacterium]
MHPAVRTALLGCLLAGPAAAFEPLSGELVAGSACEAFVGFRRQTNPDGLRLEAGRHYVVQGRNRPDGDWLQITVPGATPSERWVERGCGPVMAAAAAAPAPAPEAPAASPPPASAAPGLRPFFDAKATGRDDPSPPPPELGPLDQAVLAVCGPWGSRPHRADFRAMLDRPDLAPVVARLAASLPDGSGSLARRKELLADAWFGRGGFAHVFCGEPRAAGLGGLHYAGRYLELQQAGLAGLASRAECRAADIAPPVYTICVRYRDPDQGDWRLACPKGYALDLDAEAILTAASRAWGGLRGARGESMCLASLPSGAEAVVVVKGGAIVTFYPDATPRCDGGGPPKSCACSP